MSSATNLARELAYDAFIGVMEQRKKPDELVDALIIDRQAKLSRLDRAFIKEVLYGGLRWYSKIFWIVQKTSSKDLMKSSPEIRAALVLGTYQIFYMDRVPDRAAVNESVEYIRGKGQAKAVSFVNGILRSIARRAEYFSKPDKDRRPCEYLALQYAHPRWLVDRWYTRFGFDRLKDLLSLNNQPPPCFIRLNNLKVPKDKTQEFRERLLAEERVKSHRKSLRSCLSVGSMPILGEGSLFSQGYFSIQDEAAQLIAPMLGVEPGDCVIDACAGPGGKTGHLFELCEGKAEIKAIEKSGLQFKRLKQNMARLGHQGVECLQADFLSYSPGQKVDRILLDAPCSGLGVLRRRPDGKWHKKVSLIATMVAQQRKLLRHAVDILAPGGELVYAVCSFEPDETIEQLRWILGEVEGVEVVSPSERLPDYYKRFITRDPMLLIYAGNKDDMDGFGAFILRKKNADSEVG